MKIRCPPKYTKISIGELLEAQLQIICSLKLTQRDEWLLEDSVLNYCKVFALSLIAFLCTKNVLVN
jgi:hypothetical protein